MTLDKTINELQNDLETATGTYIVLYVSDCRQILKKLEALKKLRLEHRKIKANFKNSAVKG